MRNRLLSKKHPIASVLCFCLLNSYVVIYTYLFVVVFAMQMNEIIEFLTVNKFMSYSHTGTLNYSVKCIEL